MERINQALIWLATATLVTGAILLAWLMMNAGQPYAGAQFGWTPGDNPGIVAVFVVSFAPVFLVSLTSWIAAGAGILGLTLAWARYRYRWALALGALLLAAALFPIFVEILLRNGTFVMVHPRVSGWLGQYDAVFTLLGVLAAPALALVYARREGAGQPLGRIEADAEIGITRSAL